MDKRLDRLQKRLRARGLHLAKEQLKRFAVFAEHVREAGFKPVFGPKEILFLATIALIAAASIMVWTGVSAEFTFLLSAALSAMIIVGLYGTTISTYLSDVLLYLPFRVALAVSLIGGYVWLVSRAIAEFTNGTLNAKTVGLSALWIFGYMFGAPMVYKYLSKFVAYLSLRFFRVRPYFEQIVRGELISKYYLKPRDYGLTNLFLKRGIRGLFIYPEEPLFMPAVREIKRKIGEGIVAVSLEDLRKMLHKKEFAKYFKLVAILRPEIEDTDTYYEMFPFITMITEESIKEVDLGSVRTTAELEQLLISIRNESEANHKADAIIRAEPWYDRTLHTVFSKRPALFFFGFLSLAGAIFLFFRKSPEFSLIFPIGLMLGIDILWAFYNLFFKQQEQLAEAAIEE